MDFRNKIFRNFESYVSGEQPETEDWLKLNSNENPFPPSPQVQEALQELAENSGRLRKYPNALGEPLRSAIAARYHLPAENVNVFNGSDEALSLICRIFLDPEDTICAPEITYTLYSVIANSAGARYTGVPMQPFPQSRGDKLAVDIDALEEAKAKIVFLPNPNAPTGEFIPVETIIERIKSSKKLWVIDEAYNDFVEDKNASIIEALNSLPNAIVLRTFSKSYSLAGLRIGFSVSSNPIINDAFRAAKDSYNEDMAALLAGKAAFEDTEYLKKTVSAIQTERKRLTKELSDLQFETLPSQGNFILTRPLGPGNQGKQIMEELKKRKILVRHFSTKALGDYLRITIGAREENETLLRALREILTQ